MSVEQIVEIIMEYSGVKKEVAEQAAKDIVALGDNPAEEAVIDILEDIGLTEAEADVAALAIIILE